MYNKVIFYSYHYHCTVSIITTKGQNVCKNLNVMTCLSIRMFNIMILMISNDFVTLTHVYALAQQVIKYYIKPYVFMCNHFYTTIYIIYSM